MIYVTVKIKHKKVQADICQLSPLIIHLTWQRMLAFIRSLFDFCCYLLLPVTYGNYSYLVCVKKKFRLTVSSCAESLPWRSAVQAPSLLSGNTMNMVQNTRCHSVSQLRIIPHDHATILPWSHFFSYFN